MISTSAVLFICVVGALCVEDRYIGKLPRRSRTRPSLDIINGNKTSITKYPYIASLQNNGTQNGAAVILNPNWLVTTGWAVDGLPLSDLELRVGSSTYDKQGQVLKADKVIIHPKYSSESYDYNIAVVKTNKPIKFGKKVQSIALSTKKLKAGTKAWTAGWGYFDSTNTNSEILREAQLTAYIWKKCKETYRSRLTKRLMCTFDEDVSPCANDFGNPLVFNNEVQGLYAGGIDCNQGYPVLFTDVTALYHWVNSTITSFQ